ncbi:MAG: HAMP domain-containing sensor histidine kinase [Patescibacteria group bacterium]
MKLKIRHTLFFRFFWTLVLLGVMPLAISAFFLVATYQSRIADKVSSGVADELLRNASIQFFLIFLFVLIIATFSAFIVSRNISRPLRTLTEAARLIGEGNLNIQIKVSRRDEIGNLGSFFNEMAGNLKEVQERQAEISRLKSEFITVAAHQLRTPLSIMKWSHHTILDGDVGKVPIKQRELIEKAEVANESMIRLVHNLLDAARIEEGRFGYKFDSMDVRAFLHELVDEKKIFAENKNTKLELKDSTSGPVEISGDKERLAMAVGNIIDNAVRYTPPNGTVSVSLEYDDAKLRITIHDNGAGIPQKDQEKLFTKFYRAQSTMHVETEGTGLGLFIAKNVVEGHNGSIWFESHEGQGTSFFISLPAKGSLQAAVNKSYDTFVKNI